MQRSANGHLLKRVSSQEGSISPGLEVESRVQVDRHRMHIARDQRPVFPSMPTSTSILSTLVSSQPRLLPKCLAQIDSHGCSTFYSPIVGRIHPAVLDYFPFRTHHARGASFHLPKEESHNKGSTLVLGHPLMAIRPPLPRTKRSPRGDCSYDSHYSPPSLLRVPRVVCAPRRSIQRCSRQRPGRSPTRSRGVRARRASACV